MKTFYQLLANSLLAALANNFVWFALSYWLYLETKSVLATSIMGGTFLVAMAFSSIWFGSIVDHHKKKTAMMISSVASLVFFSGGFLVYFTAPEDAFTVLSNLRVWILVFLLLAGVIAGNIRNIALPTVTTLLVDEANRDKANGMAGMIMGISFSVVSVASSFSLAYLGMDFVLITGLACTTLAILHLAMLPIQEKRLAHGEVRPKVDIRGTIQAIKDIPGLFGLIFFTTFNNFLGGVFMSLMDPYGLSLVSLQTWGTLWGVLSFGFIFGGMYIAKKGLGVNPLKTLFKVNVIMWLVCIFFTIQPSIVLLAVGMLIYMCLVPFIEATEQTIVQKVVPVERQGRVFGFAQSVEQAASPITAFMIGPIAQFIFIPFMTDGAGAALIGDWFGTGIGRGIALVFTLTGVIGLTVTLLALHSRSYKLLSNLYKAKA